MNTQFTPVVQTRVGADGNCFDACVASVLGMSIEDTPHFNDYKSEKWFKLREWLNDRGYDYVHTPSINIVSVLLPYVPIICSGDGGRGHRHAVVMRLEAPNTFNLKLLHDPYPEGKGLVDDEVEFYLFIFKSELSREKINI